MLSSIISSKSKTLMSDKGDPHDILIEAKGERYARYREQWRSAGAFEIETPMPTQVDFELNPSCNLKCKMCTWSALETSGGGRENWMPFERYTAIIDEIADEVHSLDLNYVNEPLVRQDIAKFVEYATKKGIVEVMFNSNGMLLTETISRQLIEAGLSKLSVSLDANSQETYDKIRVGGNLPKILRNIDTFLRVRAQMKAAYPLFKVTFLRLAVNEHELKAFVDRWRSRAELMSIQNPANPFDGAQLAERTEIFGHKFDHLDQSEGGAKIEVEEAGAKDRRCPMPFQRITVRANGDVLPCCEFRGADLVVGNAFKSSIRDIWNGPEMRKLREIHKAGRYHENPVCKACMENYSLQAPSETDVEGRK